MAKTSEEIRGEVLKLSLAALLGIATFVGSKVVDELSAPFLNYILPGISKTLLCWLLMLVFLIALGAVSYALVLHNEAKQRPLMERYVFNPKTAISTHKKTEMTVCTACLLKDIESPLIHVDDDQFRCINCKLVYLPKRGVVG